jgi:hypothetical protein
VPEYRIGNGLFLDCIGGVADSVARALDSAADGGRHVIDRRRTILRHEDECADRKQGNQENGDNGKGAAAAVVYDRFADDFALYDRWIVLDTNVSHGKTPLES